MRTRSSKTLFNMNETENLAADGQILLNAMRQEFISMKTEMTQIVNAKNELINSLQSQLVELQSELKRVKNDMDEADSYERRDCVILSGNLLPPVSPDEDCSKVFVDTLKKELKMNINVGDLNTVHRLGPKPLGPGNDTRKIIAKLVRRDLKKDLIVASKKVKGLFINESLTPTRSSILFSVRKIKKNHASIIKGYTTINGNVYVFTPPEGTSSSRDIRHLINTREKLAEFCRAYIKKELESFLEAWQN